MSTAKVSEEGSLLQEAVYNGRKEFVPILLEFGLVHFLIDHLLISLFLQCSFFRVDPTKAVLHSGNPAPMEMAVLYQWDEPEIFKMLAEFKEIPDDVKILQLMMLIFRGLGGERTDDDGEKLKEEFQKILQSVSSVEMVKQHLLFFQPKYSGER